MTEIILFTQIHEMKSAALSLLTFLGCTNLFQMDVFVA
jgi:hypothetical protein